MITLIIPVKNEELKIEKLLRDLKNFDKALEIIVVDGGSEDETVTIASRYAKVIETRPGRGHQLHLGTQYAHGDILWFVHADSLITEKAIDAIKNVFEQDKHNYIIGGCLKLRFHDYDTWYMRLLATTSNWRAIYLKLMFGDQGIFILKDAYNSLGGFKDMALMEDWEFSRQMSKHGKLKVLNVSIGTSGRRYKSGGFIRTLLSMHRIKLLYILGYPPEQLAKKYREIRS